MIQRRCDVCKSVIEENEFRANIGIDVSKRGETQIPNYVTNKELAVVLVDICYSDYFAIKRFIEEKTVEL